MVYSCTVFDKGVLSFQEIRHDVTTRGENLSWLKSRLKILMEVSSENEAQQRGDELAKLSSSFKELTTLLSEVYQFLALCVDGSLSFGYSFTSNFTKKL